MSIPEVIAAHPITTIADVVRVMRAIDAALPDSDGVKWFNLLYLRVTESVLDVPPQWEDEAWLAHLDIVFAKLYFDALLQPDSPSRAWRPLLETRQRSGIAPIQFALAGMNAHINHDLPLAVVQTCTERGVPPASGTPQHRDFVRVDGLLETVEGQVKDFLATGLVGHLDRQLWRVDDVVAIWKMRKARATAWNNAEVLWHLRHAQVPRQLFVGNLANLVELSSRGLLVPVTKTWLDEPF